MLEFLTKILFYVPSLPVDGSIKMLKNSISKISIKRKNCKTLYKYELFFIAIWILGIHLVVIHNNFLKMGVRGGGRNSMLYLNFYFLRVNTLFTNFHVKRDVVYLAKLPSWCSFHALVFYVSTTQHHIIMVAKARSSVLYFYYTFYLCIYS